MRKLLFPVLLLFTLSATAQHAAGTSLFDLLGGEEVREITLRTDLVALLETETVAPEYQPATMTFFSESTGTQAWDLKVRVRGKFRRQVCEFPPLKLNFSKTTLANQGLAKHDKMKLVTHCTEAGDAGRNKVLREYLAYKLYAALSPYSYRVQLVQIQYLDAAGRLSGFERYGFLIEGTGELEDRLRGEECEDCTYQPTTAFAAEATGLHAMFQYLIGNADYSIPVLRNVKLIRRAQDEKIIPVGYDFDFSGLVDAPYAIPANYLGQITIRQRIYLGTLATDEEMRKTLEVFFTNKEELITIIQQFRLLSSTERHELKEYLLTFYEQVEMIRAGGYRAVYQQLRQEHPGAVPDGGIAAEYGVEVRK